MGRECFNFSNFLRTRCSFDRNARVTAYRQTDIDVLGHAGDWEVSANDGQYSRVAAGEW
jgi:hypothetical protein